MLEYTQLGNTALKPEYLPEETEQIQQQIVKTHKKAVKASGIPTAVKIKVISRILLVTALALLMIARFAAVSIANVTLENTKLEIEKQKSKNSDLESILAGTMQLDTIQDKAMALGMAFPSSEQMVYVQLVPYEDLVANNQTQIENNHKSIVSQIID